MPNLGPKRKHYKKLFEIQDKAVHIISFKDKNYPTNELYNKILKTADFIKLFNCLFVKSILSNNHLPIFENLFKKAHSYSTNMLPKTWYFYPQPETDHYGKFCITYQAASTSNYVQNKLDIDMLEQSNSKFKNALVQLRLQQLSQLIGINTLTSLFLCMSYTR